MLLKTPCTQMSGSLMWRETVTDFQHFFLSSLKLYFKSELLVKTGSVCRAVNTFLLVAEDASIPNPKQMSHHDLDLSSSSSYASITHTISLLSLFRECFSLPGHTDLRAALPD